MVSILKLPQLAWYGIKEGDYFLPDRWQVKTCNMTGFDASPMKPDEIRMALSNPIGTRPLHELAHGKKEVVIIFDDMSRATRTYQIVPHVLDELAKAGIKDCQIRFICALGCHSALTRIDFVKKLGEDVLKRFPVYNHNPFGNCVTVGQTETFKTEVYVNEEVMKCDLKIAIGGVVPHPMSGYGGGGKMILPGITSFATTQHNHQNTYQAMFTQPGKLGQGNFNENPMRFDVEEAAELTGLDFLINVFFNTWGNTVKMFAGALKPTYSAAVQEAKTHYLTSRVMDKDIAIANAYIKSNEAFIGLSTAYSAIGEKGGDVVLIANEPSGQVTHYLLGPFGNNSFGPLHQRSGVPPKVRRVIVFTEYPDFAGKGWFSSSEKLVFLNKWEDVLQVLETDYPHTASVAVFPNSEIQYVR